MKDHLRQVHSDMMTRCYNPNYHAAHRYSQRGIAVCEQWHDRSVFVSDILNSIGPRPSPDHTFGRIENDGNYEPGNVAWQTRKEQQDNTIRSRQITAFDQTASLRDWCREIGCQSGELHKQLDNWPTPELAIRYLLQTKTERARRGLKRLPKARVNLLRNRLMRGYFDSGAHCVDVTNGGKP
jgi:hypothetical protein